MAIDTDTLTGRASEDPEHDLLGRPGDGVRFSTRVLVLLGLILTVGLIVRITGWNSRGFYFDDAWTALPARVPLGTALHMWLSSPGYTFAQREWTLIWPDNLRWVTAFPLITGVVAPAVAFGLGRILRFPNWIALAMAGFVAAEPVAIQYSVAIKPFELDLVAGMVLLGIAESVRTRRGTQTIAALVIFSVAAVFMDVALVTVVAGSWAALALIAYFDKRRLSSILVGAGLAGLAVFGLVLSVKIPYFDTRFFREFDTLVGPPYTLGHLSTVFSTTGAGLAHGILDTPTPFVYRESSSLMQFADLVALLEFALFVLLALPAVKACVQRRPDDPAMRDLAPVFVVFVAMLAYFAGKYPIGEGRSDLVLLPAIIVLLASGLQRLAGVIRRRMSIRAASRLAIVAALVAALGAGALAWDQRAWYPTQDLKALDQQLVRHMQSNDVLVVSFRNSYTWAYDQLSPFRTHYTTSDLSYGIGFWVSFDPPHVLAEGPPLGFIVLRSEIPGLSRLPSTDRRLWLIGTTQLNFSPSQVHPSGAWAQSPVYYGVRPVLTADGWHETSTTLEATGVFANLYVRSP